MNSSDMHLLAIDRQILPCERSELCMHLCFFFNDTAPTEIYTLSLHDALPICSSSRSGLRGLRNGQACRHQPRGEADRKSTRLNSSHLGISYAVFCLKKKN